MGVLATLLRPYAAFRSYRLRRAARSARARQRRVFRKLIRRGQYTRFGRDHGFGAIRTHADFVQRVPLRTYEDLRPYIERTRAGASDELWPGRPRYFATTSGTTSGAKYIPISQVSLSNHFGTASTALFHYARQTGNYAFLDGYLIFLSGSPELYDTNGIPTGRLSGISNHLIPAWLKARQLPSYATNCIDDWEAKIDAVVRETAGRDLRLISGIPPWVQMYFERLLAHTGKASVLEVFPNFSVFVYGGVNYAPYRARLEALIGGPVDTVETYPASEGFLAFQDRPGSEDLLLNVDSGIFFEFVPLDRVGQPDAPRLTLDGVTLGVDYALVLSTTAGLWAYQIGDTVRFVSLDPPRIRVSGRVTHYTSAFGEHVIGVEIERALREALELQPATVTELTVAPQVTPAAGLPHHEWLVEFAQAPADPAAFAAAADAALRRQNRYYEDLRRDGLLRELVLTVLPEGAFQRMMRARGKLGGQNKVPRLTNDRELAELLLQQ